VTNKGNPVLTESVDGILIITINRPQARNSINTATAEAIGLALDELDNKADLTAGIITGAGGFFCAGMDLKAFLAGEKPSIPVRGFAGIVEKPSEKPLIAAVEGYALAGGFEIALACDVIVASREAKFGLPEVARGLVAAGGGLMRLPQRVPYHLAMEWALTGRLIEAEEAYRASLVTHLTNPGAALDKALEIATRIVANGPMAVRATKKIIVQSQDWTLEESFHRQREISEPIRESDDAKEGAQAFTQKRPPVWQGK
jgi:enoyl-CoA hydratase|tara:strand:+ start:468 stop:1241 length:774 start_codon:yes stop_codon:yes gene_type:complete